MSLLYSAREISQFEEYNAQIFILAGGTDERALAMATELSEKAKCLSEVLLLDYGSFDLEPIQTLFPGTKINVISVPRDPIEYLSTLQSYSGNISVYNNVLIDITSMRIPEMLVMLKFMDSMDRRLSIQISYSTPFEYEFPAEPFTSYHSYYGNLRTTDILGFGGMSEDMSHSKMVIFLGFEGVLSSKVSEDIKYDKLILVNNLPSFFEKYKDICVINNRNLLNSNHEKLAYVPANNPFEIYNFLAEHIDDNEPVCIAPLSSKPVALGVCLYALTHDNVRVIYPMADEYNYHRANSVHNTYVYDMPAH